MEKAEGALIAEVKAASPAANAGIESGDIVISVDGQDVKNSNEFALKIAEMAPGAEADLGFLRGSPRTVAVTLETMPSDKQLSKLLGMTLEPARSVEDAGGKGVIVTAVDLDGAAVEHGLQAGDVILEVDGKAVSTPADVREDIHDTHASGRHNVLMRVWSGTQARFVALPLGNG